MKESRLQEQLGDAGDAKRALLALEAAVERAEQRPGSDLIVASPADYRAAGDAYMADLRRSLDRIMMSKDAEAGLDALLDAGALSALLPEVSAMVGFGDGEWRHKDVWKHTKQVVRQAVPKLEIRWAALLHDIGKIKTRSISPSGEVHFFGHAEVGARMFDRMQRRLPLFTKDDALQSTVRFLILHHLRASQYEPSWTDSAVRRFAREMGPLLDEVLCLSRADITTKRPEKKKRGLRQISELADRVDRVLASDAEVPPLPSGVGDEIMRVFALPPSRLIGDIKRRLESEIAEGKLEGHRDSEFYLDLLHQDPSAYGLPSKG